MQAPPQSAESPQCMEEEIFSNDDLLKLVLSACCFTTPLEDWCWTALVPGRSSSARSSCGPMLALRSLAPLRLVSKRWHACATALLEEPHDSIDLSGVLCWPLGSSAQRSLRTLLLSCTGPSLPQLELPALRALSLRGCTQASGAIIHDLCAPCSQLRRLDLSGCSRLGEAALRGLHGMALTHLDLEGVRLSPAMAAHAGQIRSLQWLNLGGCQLSCESLEALALSAAAPGLRSLGLEGLRGISHRAFADALCQLRSLTELSLAESSLADGALHAIATLPLLVALDLSELDAEAHAGKAPALEAALLVMPALRHLNLLRCGAWLTHEQLWRLGAARIAVRHDLLPPRRPAGGSRAEPVSSWELLDEIDDLGALALAEPPSSAPAPALSFDYTRRHQRQSIYHVSQGDEPLYGNRSRRGNAQVGEWRRQEVVHTDAHGLRR